jgi:hypothetical protein
MTKYDLAAHLTLEGFDGYHGTLTATQQRTLFGAALFGKKTVRISCDNQGLVEVFHACWEGTHTSYSVEALSFACVCARLRTGVAS